MAKPVGRGPAGIVPFLLFALLLTIPPAAEASPEAPAEVRIDDVPDDVKITSNGQSQPAPAGIYDHIDILATWIGAETVDALEVGIQFKALDSQVPMGRTFFALNFARPGADGEDPVSYRVVPFGRDCPDPPASLQVFDEGRGYRALKCVDTVLDEGTATYRYTLLKADLVDAKHAPLGFGDSLAGFYATATSTLVPGTGQVPVAPVPVGSTAATDRAPDQGEAPPYVPAMGVSGEGPLRLDSAEPVRVSNGEATTIVYQARLHNDGEAAQDAFLALPETTGRDWEIRVPPRLHVEAGQVVNFPVILTMPFSHTHGETWTFTVRATSGADASWWTEQEFGVFFTDVPQPSEHHGGLLYLHSADFEDADDPFTTALTTAYDFKRTWMNPEPEDPEAGATDEAVPAYFNEALFDDEPGVNGVARWDFTLSPSLLIGLDFDAALPATFLTRIHHPLPSDGAQIQADLLYCDPGDESGGGGDPGGFVGNDGCSGAWRTIARGGSGVTNLAANGDSTFEFTLQVAPDADLLPYQKGANLRLRIRLLTETPENLVTPEPKPLLYPNDSVLQLPLLEYHDPVEQSFLNVGTLRLDHGGPNEKRLNPGRTSVFPFTLTNTGSDAQEVLLEVVGTNKEWARFPTGPEVSLPPGVAQNLQLVVAAPDIAQPDQRADLFVVAQSAADPNVAAVARLRATIVDPAFEDIPDESGQVAQGKPSGSPGFEALFVAAAVVGLVGLHRRRRDA